jgi:hypothetical protein
VKSIFKAHSLVINLAKDQEEFKTKFIKNIEEKLTNFTVIYNQKVSNQPQ